MKHILPKYIISLGLSILSITAFAQDSNNTNVEPNNLIYKESVTFSSYCKNSGPKIDNMYRWSELEKDSAVINYDKVKEIITIDDRKFEVLEKPSPYSHRAFKYKYTTIQCIDEEMKKVFVKISYYYNGKKSVAILGEETGIRYWVK